MDAELGRLEETRLQDVPWPKMGTIPLGAARIFLRDECGRRAVYGGTEKLQTDPHWRDHVLFYEYFHGDNGAGLGVSHQAGWTGVVAKLIQLFGMLDAERMLEVGKEAAYAGSTTDRGGAKG